MEPVSNPNEARAALEQVAALRRRTRRASQAFWFPSIAFAVLILVSSPLYAVTNDGSTSGAGGLSRFALLGGLGTDQPARAGLFWLIALPVGYALTAAFYLWRTHRRGVAMSWRAYVFSGLALFVLVAFLLSTFVPAIQRQMLSISGDLFIRGLIPLVLIAIGLLLLAVVERSLLFGLFAVGFLAVALVANLYDLSNVANRLGLQTTQPYVNNVVVGVVLLVAGLLFAFRANGLRLRIPALGLSSRP